MKLTLEPIVYIMRFHENDNAILGDPYVSSATLTVIDGVATILGFTSLNEYTTENWKAANDEFYKIGIKKVIFHRIKDGKNRLFTIVIKPPKNDI